MKIIIAGDLFVSDQYYNHHIIGKSVQDLFSGADYRMINLEAPITNDSNEHKINKTGPHLRMSDQAIADVLRQLSVDGVTLANNHILDHGTKGLIDTFYFLKNNDIDFVGAGVNLRDASKCLTINKDGMKIAIINFCENEWSVAEEELAGANPMDTIDNANQIREAKSSHDRVIVIVHGGHEYYNLPSPRMQKQYRFYADQGADMVIGHHTHCISGNEMYKGVPIYYSLGNFLFTKNNPNDEWYTGLVLEVDITNESVGCKIHPVSVDKNSFELSLLESEEKVNVLNRIDSFNNVIGNPDELQVQWKNYQKKKSREYLNYWSPLTSVRNRYLSGVLRRVGGNYLNKNAASLHLNLLRCEAHRNLSEEILKKYISR